MAAADLKPNCIVRGRLFAEPVRVIALNPRGENIELVGEGLQTGKVHRPSPLTAHDEADIEHPTAWARRGT